MRRGDAASEHGEKQVWENIGRANLGGGGRRRQAAGGAKADRPVAGLADCPQAVVTAHHHASL